MRPPPRLRNRGTRDLVFATLTAGLVLGCASEPSGDQELDRLLARRVQGMSSPLDGGAALEAGARGLATAGRRIQQLQELEAERLTTLSGVGTRAAGTLEDEVRKFSRSGERAAHLLGIDASPLPDPSDAERDTDPFQTRPRTSLWARVLQRLGF